MKDKDLERGSISLSQCWSLTPHLRFPTGTDEGVCRDADEAVVEAERDRRLSIGDKGKEGSDLAKVRAEGEN